MFCLVYIYICYVIIRSPYLFVFGDDRVHGTRKYMMLQVDLVRHRAGAWARLGKEFSEFYVYVIK